jgi:hypothetical protein
VYNFVDFMTISPTDLRFGDAIALKIVAVAGGDHMRAAYMGATNLSDRDVAESGDKIDGIAAERMFPQFKNAEWRYRR